ALDTRTYQDLVDEALARIPIHIPEWTNFNRSDPGVTLIELFAFLTESLLYRANQIPERNRRAFLSLLGVPLQPASSARGVVTFSNDSGPQRAITLHGDLELRAGQVPFRTELGLDVPPGHGRPLALGRAPAAARGRNRRRGARGGPGGARGQDAQPRRRPDPRRPGRAPLAARPLGAGDEVPARLPAAARARLRLARRHL